jgi:hypothetical protein
VVFVDEQTNKELSGTKAIKIAGIPYYATFRQPVRITLPELGGQRQRFRLVLRLSNNKDVVSSGMDRVEVFAKPATSTASSAKAEAAVISLEPKLNVFVKGSGLFSKVSETVSTSKPASTVLLIGNTDIAAALQPKSPTRQLIEQGATAIVFSPGKEIIDLFPNDVTSVKKVTGEFADFAPSFGMMLTLGMQSMDIKWWGREDDWRVFVASSAHTLKPGGSARELIRFIPAHGYIAEARVPEQYMTVLFEIPVGKGRLWVCDLDLEKSVEIDPAARLFATNLLKAAADPLSTKVLPVVPTHKESLAGKSKPYIRKRDR